LLSFPTRRSSDLDHMLGPYLTPRPGRRYHLPLLPDVFEEDLSGFPVLLHPSASPTMAIASSLEVTTPTTAPSCRRISSILAWSSVGLPPGSLTSKAMNCP